MRRFRVLFGAFLLAASMTLPAVAQDRDRGGDRGSDRADRAGSRDDTYAGYRSGADLDRQGRPTWRERDPLLRQNRDYGNSRETADRLIYEDNLRHRSSIIRTPERDEPRRWYSEPDGQARVIRNPRLSDDRESTLDSRASRNSVERASGNIVGPETHGFTREEARLPYVADVQARRTGYTARDYAEDRWYRDHWDRRDRDHNRDSVSVRYHGRPYYGYHYYRPYVLQRPFHRPHFTYRPYYPPPVVYYPAPYYSPYYCPPGLSIGFRFDFD